MQCVQLTAVTTGWMEGVVLHSLTYLPDIPKPPLAGPHRSMSAQGQIDWELWQQNLVALLQDIFFMYFIK